MADTPNDPNAGRSSEPESSGAGSGHSRARTAAFGTAATVVGLATGVLTLKDQLFPPDQPTPQTVVQYQQQVGEVCDRVNAVQSSHLRRARPYKKRLTKAKDLGELRNAVMDEVQNRIDSGGDLRGRLAGLETPSRKVRAIQEETVANWDKGLSALQAYREELEGVRSSQGLERAVGEVDRSSIERSALQTREQLQRLGGPACDLKRRKTSAVVDLPRIGSRGGNGDEGASSGGGNGDGGAGSGGGNGDGGASSGGGNGDGGGSGGGNGSLGPNAVPPEGDSTPEEGGAADEGVGADGGGGPSPTPVE